MKKRLIKYILAKSAIIHCRQKTGFSAKKTSATGIAEVNGNPGLFMEILKKYNLNANRSLKQASKKCALSKLQFK